MKPCVPQLGLTPSSFVKPTYLVHQAAMMEICKRLIMKGYKAIGAPQLGPKAWERFEPYLLIDSVKTNLRKILAGQASIACFELFEAVDLLMETHELSLPHYDKPTLPDLNKDTLLVDLLLGAEPEQYRKERFSRNERAFFPFLQPMNYHHSASYATYQELLHLLADSGRENCLLDDVMREFQTHLLELVSYIVKMEQASKQVYKFSFRM